MNYIVSRECNYSIEGYQSVSSLSDVLVVDSTSVVIIHSFDEDAYKGSLIVTDLYRKRGVYKFIYINKNPLQNIRVLIEGMNGIYEEDEYLLTDENEIKDLVFLLDDNKLELVKSSELNIKTGLSVMSDFLKMYEDNGDNDPLYFEVLARSFDDIKRQVRLQDERIALMSKGVIDAYNSTLDVINRLNQEAEDMKERLADIESSAVRLNYGRVESLSYYPPIVYAGSTPVAVFKEITSCRYLTSYVLAYANHLQTVRSKRVRVIFVIGKQSSVKSKYKEMFELTKDNYKTAKAILETVSYTVSPIKALMLHMTKQSDELVIVVDRTYEKEPIVKGRAEVFYGVSSLGEITRENLKIDRCIVPIREVNGTSFIIKHIQNFPSDPDSRLDRYERTFNKEFNILDGVLKLDKV